MAKAIKVYSAPHSNLLRACYYNCTHMPMESFFCLDRASVHTSAAVTRKLKQGGTQSGQNKKRRAQNRVGDAWAWSAAVRATLSASALPQGRPSGRVGPRCSMNQAEKVRATRERRCQASGAESASRLEGAEDAENGADDDGVMVIRQEKSWR